MNEKPMEVARPSPVTSRSRLLRLLPIILLLLLLAVGAVPQYLKGTWSWAKPPRVENLKQLRALTKTGLELSGWKTQQQQKIEIGGHSWSAQQLQSETGDEDKPLILLVRPQKDAKIQPEIDWVDIKGLNNWKTDSYRSLKLKAKGAEGEYPITVRFFRAWNDRQTFVVAQWYAWPEGGSPNPAVWFATDQAAQLKGQRQPWIAISLQKQIAPLAEIEPEREEMEALVEQIHERAIATTQKTKS